MQDAAQYCARQNAHAFMLLWALFLILTAAALALRRNNRPFRAVLLFFAFCTAALGIAIFSACAAYAPLSMGLPTSISATAETTLMCLSKDTLDTVVLWTIIVALSCASFGSLLWARARSRSSRTRAFTYAGTAVLALAAIASVLLEMFAFSLCSTHWVE